MPVDIFIEDKWNGDFQILGEAKVHALKRDLKDALDDISESIFRYASAFAPESSPDDKAGGSARDIPSGALKAHPVDILHSGFGEAAAVGASGFRFRAPAGSTDAFGNKIGGQFISGATEGHQGHVFYVIDIELPRDPFYAKFVHEGVAPHGPATAEKMKFRYQGANWSTKWVSGQEANPYLARAIEAAQYDVDLKVGELRAEARFL